MKYRFFAALCAVFVMSSALAAELTRSVALSADQTSAVFAVPNGFSFTRAYACDAQGGSVPVSVGEPTTMNHVTLIPVAVDLSASPSTSSLNLTVVFEDNGPLFTGRPAKVMREAIKEKVANPEDVPTTQYVAPTRSRLKLAVSPLSEGGQSLDEGGRSPDEPSAQKVDGADVLILSPHDNIALWRQYATFRKSTAAGRDLIFKVIDLDDVYAVYPWTGDSPSVGVRNAAESIHKYLRESCDKFGVSYVILGGSWINAQHLNGSNQWTNSDGNVIYLQTNVEMSLANCVPGIIANPRQNEEDPSDMFYACLNLLEGQTYPWCVGTSSKYFDGASDSKNLGKCDSGVDVIVSRLPLKPTKIGEKIYTAAELMTAFIAKIERAESSDFSGTGRLGSLWGAVGSTPDVNGSLPTEYEFYDDADNMFDADRITRKFNDAEVAQRAMIKDHVAKYYPVRAVDTLSAQLWTKGFETYNDAIAAYFASDRDYAGIDSHGWADGSEALSCGNFDTATGITLLNDVSVPCQTGWQDRTGAGKDYNSELTGKTVAVPCAGEAAVQGPTGGAIASLNNSRTGLTGPLGSNSLSYLLYHESAKAFLHQGKDAGNSWLSAHLAFVGSEFNPSSPVAKELGGGGAHTLEEHTLFGDPLIKSQVSRADGVLAENTSVSGVNAYINATVNGALTLSGEGRIKVLQTLSVSGTTFTVEDGIEGGIGQKVVFTGEEGRIVVNTTKRFYLGGVENCSEIVVNGSNVIIDCDRLTNVEKITFNMAAGVSNTIRGIKKNALDGVNIESTGGTLVFETSDVLGGTSVKLEGTTIVLGADPQSGSLVASGEPLRGTFSGSGIIKYKHGTELMKDWTITGSIQTVDDGSEIEPGLIYTGLVGQNPTGWFSGWASEGFNANHAVLGPKGFVSYVENGNHPHVSLAAKKGFTLSLYADLTKVSTEEDAVMLSLGTSNDNQNGQLLLMSDHGKIKLVITGTNGGSAAKKYENLFAVTPGYHLYTIERVVATNTLKLYIDGVVKVNDTPTFSLGTGLQLGSQFGGLKVSRSKALGMAVAGLIGYDAVLTADDLAAHVLDYPATGAMLTNVPSVNLSAGNDMAATLSNATFAENTYLGANNGAMTIPEGKTVSVPGIKLLNASQAENVATLNIEGTLNVTGISSDNGPYYDFANDHSAGIMMGHWGGSSTINVTSGGVIDMPNGTLLINYDATGAQLLNINGGTVKVKALTNYVKNQYGNDRKTGDHGSVIVQNGGTLEVAAWPIKSATQLGTMPIAFNNGTLRGTADWTCLRPLTVSGPMTIDAAGHNLIFSGAITGAGNISVIDSSVGKTGSVIFVGSLEGYTGTITVASSVAKFGVRREYVGSSKISFATRPATLIVALSAEQLQEAYTASPYAGYMNAGSTVVFTDYDGYVYQETAGTTSFAAWRPKTYTYDGIDWSYIFLPYERGVWEPLINWRTIWTNGTEENAARLFTSGPAPQLANSNRWYPIILNGAEFQSDDDLVDGLHFVRATRLEGWNPRIGVYNGVHLYIDEFFKFQHGKEYDNGPQADKWLRVDDKSRITIAKVGTGNSSGTMKFYVGGENALVFKTNVAGNTSEYYFTGDGSVKFESGVKAGTHAVKEVHATHRETSGEYYNLMGVKIADFNNKGSTARFTSENGALKLAGYNETTRYLANSLAVLNDAKSNGIGGFTLMQGDAGVYAMYAEKSATPPTEITINGNQTALDLTNLPYDTITKIKIAGAWGYFKGDDHRISTQVEFNDTAAGLPAFRWENGYGSKYVAFENATGHGTIFINGGTLTSQAMFFKGGDFDGSIILTNGNNRVFFGTPTAVQQAKASRIEVKSGATANLKDGGIWAASELTINGTLNCKGAADIICFGGIEGVDHIKIPDGYVKSVMTIGEKTARVWILPEGEVPHTEGELNFQFGTVTIPSFDMGNHLLKVSSGSVRLQEDAIVVAPNLVVVEGASFVAAAKIGDTYYGSFAKAAEAANNGEKTITLLSNVENFNLAVGQRLSVVKNDYTITFADGLVVEETEDGEVTRYLSTSTRYDIVYHVKDVDNGDWDASALRPTDFSIEQLPVMLPKPTASDKVFHGWYREPDYSDTAIDSINDDMLPRMEYALYGYWLPAVATVNGIPYDNWDDAIDAQGRTGYSIKVLEGARGREPNGYFTDDDGNLMLIEATVQIGESRPTMFASFAEAREYARNQENAVITLVTQPMNALVLEDNETVLVKLSGQVLDVEVAHPESYHLHSSYEEVTEITTYTSTIKTYTISIPELGAGVSVTSVAGATRVDGIYTAEHGADVTITYAIAENYIVSGATTVSFENVTENKTASAPTATLAAAKIGTTLYATIDDAIAHASDGYIIYISGEVPDTHKIVDGKVVAKKYYTVTLGEHANATVEGLPASIREDKTADFTVTPDVGYDITAVSATGATIRPYSNTDRYQIWTPAGAVVVTVTATKKTFTVTAPMGTGLSVSATETTANYGETITITYALSENYILKSGELVQQFTYRETAQSATLPKVVKAKAKIGGALYETLDAAIAALGEGQDVTAITLIDTTITTLPSGQEDYKIVNGVIVAKKYYAVVVDATANAVKSIDGLPEGNRIREDRSFTIVVNLNDGYELVSSLGVTHATPVRWTGNPYQLKIIDPTGTVTITITATRKTFTVTAPTAAGLTVSATSVTADYSDTITIVYTVVENYIHKSGDLVQAFTYRDSDQTAILPVVAKAQAKIGNALYETIGEAIEAAGKADTITLIDTTLAAPDGYARVTKDGVVTLRKSGDINYIRGYLGADGVELVLETQEGGKTTLLAEDTIILGASATKAAWMASDFSGKTFKVVDNFTLHSGTDDAILDGAAVTISEGKTLTLNNYNSAKAIALGTLTINGSVAIVDDANETNILATSIKGVGTITLGENSSISIDAKSKTVTIESGVEHKHVVCNGTTYSLAWDQYTVTVPSVENTTCDVQVNGEAVEIRNGAITVNHGDRVVVTYSPVGSHNMTPVVKNLGAIIANTEVTVDDVNPTIKRFSVALKTFDNTTCYVKVNGGVEIVYAGAFTVNYGDRVDFRYEAVEGYNITSTDTRFWYSSVTSNLSGGDYIIETAIKTFTVTIPELGEGVSIASVTGATLVDGVYTAEYGSDVTIIYAIAANYIVSGSTSVTFENVTENKTATAPTVVKAQAKIGTKLYETLSAALSAATSGETVTVVSKPAAEAITIPAGVTLDIGYHGYNDNSGVPNGGYVITANEGAVVRGETYNAHNVTIKSLTLNGDCSIGTESSPLTGVFGFGTGERGASSITLNSHTLHVWGKDDTNFFFETTTVADAGTINMHKGRLMTHCNSFDASKTKLVFSGNSTAAFEAGATVGELEVATTGTLTVNNNQTLTIANQNTKKYLTAAEMHKISLGSGAAFNYGWQPGKVISINFGSKRVSGTAAMATAEGGPDMTMAGLVPRSSWNDYGDYNASTLYAVTKGYDSDAAEGSRDFTIDDMTIQYSSFNGFWNPTATDTAEPPFLRAYLDDAAGVRVNIRLVGIPFAKYDLIIYYQGDNSTKFRPAEITDKYGNNTKTYGYDSNFNVISNASASWGGAQNTISYEKNTIRVDGLIGSTLTVSPLSHNQGRGTIAAIQIVENNEGVVTYYRNPAVVDDDWMAENGWLDKGGSAFTWTNPTDEDGRIITAEIDADSVQTIRLTSPIVASRVVVKNSATSYSEGDCEFKFLTDEDLGHVATEDPTATCILNAPVDATGFCGDIYLQARITGAVSLGEKTHIKFVALEANKETTAYPYTFIGNISAINKIGPGIFRVPQSMAAAPYNIEAGYILYEYEGDETVQLGKVTGNGTAILKTANLQLAADNTATLDWQSDYLKVTGNLFASGSTKKLEIPEGKTVEVVDNSNNESARDGVYTGYGTVKYAGPSWRLLNNSSLPAATLVIENENNNGLIIPNITGTVELGTLKGSKGFRSDYGGSNGETKRNLRVTQRADTIWSGTFMQSTTNDRFGTFYVAGAEGATEKTLTIAGDCSGADNNLNVESSGSVKLTGVWKGNVTVNGEFGGTGTIKNSTVTFADGATINTDFGAVTLGEETSLAWSGALNIVGSSIEDGIAVLNGVSAEQVLPSIVTINGAEGGRLVYDEGCLKLFDFSKPQMLYCFHLDGDTTNAGVMGTSGVETSGTPTIVANGALSSSHAFKANSGSVVITTTDCDLTCKQGFTLSFWMNPNGMSNWQDACGFQIGDMIYKFEKNSSNQYAMYSISESGPTHTVNDTKTINFTASTWMHVAIVPTEDGKSLNVYSDGNLLMRYSPGSDKNLWGTADGAEPILKKFVVGVKGLGSYSGTNWSDADGRTSSALVDEVAIYNTALSANQIAWLAANKPSADVFDVSAHPTPFGSKVIDLSDGDECQFWSDGDTIKSRVGQKYDQVVVTLLINLLETTTATKIVTVNESSTAGASGNKADLWWNGSKLYFGYNDGSTDANTAVTVDPGLHLVSMTVINGQIQSGNCGVNVVVDGDATNKKATKTNIRWGNNYPTGTFTYQGDIKSITLDFSSSGAVSGLNALPKFTQKGAAVTNLTTISEILEMTGKSIGDKELSGEMVAADVTMGSLVETGSADTIGITVGTSLDLPNGEVSILVEDGAGNYSPLANSPTFKSPTKNDSRTIELPISSLLNGAKSRLFKIQAKPMKK